MWTRDGSIRASPARASTGDPTGAGDAFDGVLLAALATGAEVPSALQRACDAGAQCADGFDLWPVR